MATVTVYGSLIDIFSTFQTVTDPRDDVCSFECHICLIVGTFVWAQTPEAVDSACLVPHIILT